MCGNEGRIELCIEWSHSILVLIFLPLFPARLSNTSIMSVSKATNDEPIDSMHRWAGFSSRLSCLYVGRKLRKQDLFLRNKLQANAYSTLWPYIHLDPVHTYQDIFESANFSLRIQTFPRPHVKRSSAHAKLLSPIFLNNCFTDKSVPLSTSQSLL